jgi:hypothetical protein
MRQICRVLATFESSVSGTADRGRGRGQEPRVERLSGAASLVGRLRKAPRTLQPEAVSPARRSPRRRRPREDTPSILASIIPNHPRTLRSHPSWRAHTTRSRPTSPTRTRRPPPRRPCARRRTTATARSTRRRATKRTSCCPSSRCPRARARQGSRSGGSRSRCSRRARAAGATCVHPAAPVCVWC